jgi:predicted NAD/FAD-binding protein
MNIAIIGGGASGIIAAYKLDQQGHRVTVFERNSALGGHIQTLNQNVWPNRAPCDEILENGVLEFPAAFRHFVALMQELQVELEPVRVNSALFFRNGRHFLSGAMIDSNFTGMRRLAEYARLDGLYFRSAAFWLWLRFAKNQVFRNHPMSRHLKRHTVRNDWLKLLTMYSYSMPFELIDDFPAELAIPTLREYLFVNWVRVKGGVYSYIAKILERFRGRVVLNSNVARIIRGADGVRLCRSDGAVEEFDAVVFATPPDQVLQLLADPSEAERRRFGAWQANYATTVLHTDTSMYDRHGIRNLAEFDFFQTRQSWGYNAHLNQLCGISSSRHYSLAFQLEELIQADRVIHVQKHHTPLYTVAAFRTRDEIIATNGETRTYHAGAYLGEGLHEGAVTSALNVAELIG